MNKGTTVVIGLLCFLAGMGLMWGIAQEHGVQVSAEVATKGTTPDQSNSPIPIGADDPVWGKADAPVTIVEASDFECPFCSRVEPTLTRVRKEYGEDKVRIVWKNNPLPFHKSARPTADAAVTVQALGGDFWKFHDLAFANQKDLTPENYEKWAVASGVDGAKFKAAYDSKKYTAKVDKDLAVGRQIGARGTPHFMINGKPLSGAQPYEKFKEAIDEQLAAADALAKTGVPRSKVSLELTKKNFTKPEEPKPQQPPPEDTTIWKVPVGDEDPVRGADDALVTIIEYSDFQCPFCGRVEPTLAKLMDDYKGDIRLVWKDNPLPFHPRAKPAATLARFAYEKGGDKQFWAAHDALFANQSNLEDNGLEEVAKKVGLNWEKVKKAIAEDKYAARFTSTIDQAADFEARGTPHFFINGRRVSGAQPIEKFKEIVDAQLAIAKGLVAKGVPRDKVFRELMKTAKGPAEPEKKDVAAPTRENPVKGPENAKITIQEFSDFQCPFCGRAVPTIEEIMKAYPKDVKVVWRNMPLSFHQDAPLAAEAAREVFEQGGNKAFWKYHDKLFANQQNIKRPDLEKYAEELGGIDMDKFKAALDSHKHKAFIDKDAEVGNKAGVSGTPAFVINGYFVSGAQPFPAFDKVIKLAMKDK
ncbi:MAG TPA: thioredoxin domain-containing protein [Polyangiaceae bacterium]|nr:thioredoxin domain-containing protein [Polyangiaceae bacterium]